MSKESRIRGLYAIVDASYPDPAGLADKILAGRCCIIQLRSKKMPLSSFLSIAREVGAACRRKGALFIVNDRVDVAIAAEADGVHLGQDDLPLAEARRILGEGKIIGISTHCVEEAVSAGRDGADYIGFGPIYATQTKEDAHDPKGIYALKDIRNAVAIPVVAIGGIKRENARQVMGAGADAIAVISDIAEADDVTKRTEDIVKIMEEAYEC